MAIEKKLEKVKTPTDESEIVKMIKKGGSAPKPENVEKKEVIFNLRMSNDMVKKIDDDRKSLGGFVSRNTWILQAIQKNLKTKDES